MSDEMGTFRVDVEVENPAHPGDKRVLRSVPVDTGAELSWFPGDLLEALDVERRKVRQFRQADGTVLTRWTGGVSVYLAGTWTVDEVVFSELGAYPGILCVSHSSGHGPERQEEDGIRTRAAG